MFKFIVIVAIFIGSNIVSNNNNINYNPKSLNKNIEKLWGIKNALKKEIKLPDSIGNHLKGKFFAVTDKNKQVKNKYSYIGRVNSCRAGGCSISSDLHNNTESEYFDYYILYDSNKQVQLVKVFNYQATHGQEITTRGWLKQFIGFDPEKKLVVGKNIDVISGATISVHAITIDLQDKSSVLNQLDN